MIHLFKSAAARLVTYGLIGILTVGLLVGAVRLTLPFADLFRSQLEGLLAETLGLEVRVGRLGLRLAGVAPQLTLFDTRLIDPQSGHPQLHLEQLRVDWNLAASLSELKPQIESVTMVNAHLVIKRLEDGTVTVAGLAGMEGGDPEAMTFFLGNGRFLLADSDIYWIDEMTGASELHLSDVQIHFENAGDRHKIAVLARLFDNPRAHLRLVGDLRGEPGNPAAWSGEVYLHWRGEDMGQVLRGRLAADLQLGSDAIELESWHDLDGAAVTRSLNRIDVRGLTVRNRSAGEPAYTVHLDRLQGLLRWRQIGDEWQLDVDDLTLSREGTQRPGTDLRLRLRAGDDGEWALEGRNDFLDLADMRDLLVLLPDRLPEAISKLSRIRLAGALRDLRFQLKHHQGRPPDWAVAGRIADLDLTAHERVPGIQGLSAELAGNQDQGRVVVDSSDLALDLPRLLPEGIRIDTLTGEVLWRRNPDGTLQISSDEIAAANADIATRSRLTLSLPSGDGSPLLDLHTAFSNGRVESVRKYVPSLRLKKKLVSWLERAFVSGRIPSGDLLFRGTPADFPFDGQKGRFEVLFGVQDATLDYHQDWPRIKEISGTVRFLNRGVEIFVGQGRLLKSELVGVYAQIPNLKKAVAVEITGRAEGPFADGLRVLAETPLRNKLGAVAKTFEADGVSRLQLEMSVPLPRRGHREPLRLSADLTWPGPASLAIAERDLELRDLAGSLHITPDSLEAERIEASLWGVPVNLRVDTVEAAGDRAPFTRVRADGRFSTNDLARRFPAPIWDLVQGRSRWDLDLAIGRAHAAATMPPVDFELESGLAGVAVDLPAPLGKPAADTRRVHFSGRLAREEPVRVRGGYGDMGIDLALARKDGGELGLARGSLNLGGGANGLPRGEGLALGGSIASLDLPAWLNWWEKRGSSAAGAPGGNALLRSADLRVRRLLLTDMAVNDVRFDLDRRGNRWEAAFSARELDGKLSIPHRPRGEPVRIELGRLDLKGLLGHEGEEGQALAKGKTSDPRRAHTLDLSVDRLLWGENPLGRVTLRTRSIADGLDFAEMTLDGPFMSIRGSGSWTHRREGQGTSLSLTATGADLGEFLRSLEYSSMFYKAPAEVGLDLAWSGGPAQLSAASLTGSVDIEVGAGSLLEVDPGVGRMLGILNLEILQKRLSLDFSDLFERGFAFERISGKLSIRNGEAEIQTLVIDGPSANISIAGSTNLVRKDLNQIVTVTPRIGTGVAIASAVAGGPLVGAAVFLADQVTGGVVDKLGRHQYVLTGPWAKPDIRRGKLGGEAEEDTGEGLFLQERGRAGAESAREPKPREARSGPSARADPAEPGPEHGPFGKSGGENLFLEGH
jgi:uncharacterized protein (TIGR02099 family)